MAFSMGGRGLFQGQLNITPLIDVLLVLIIMFMVIVAMSKEHVVKADIPQPSNPEAERNHRNEQTIVIQILWNTEKKVTEVKINEETVAWNDLESRLASIYLSRAEKVAYVKGDDDLDFEYVAQVIAEAHNAGISRVGLMTRQ